MRLLIINGPNLNMLGIREPELYGHQTLADIEAMVRQRCEQHGVTPTFFQSNNEGALVDAIQQAYGQQDGIIINPAAYTHTSVAIRDAIAATGLPCVEVHLSNIYRREAFRHESLTAPVCLGVISGLGTQGYELALEALVHYLKSTRSH